MVAGNCLGIWNELEIDFSFNGDIYEFHFIFHIYNIFVTYFSMVKIFKVQPTGSVFIWEQRKI